MVEIIPSVASHCKILTATLREQDRLEILRIGHDPEKSVFYTYRRGLYRKTALVNGKVAAMWGVCGTPLGLTGVPYLLTSNIVEEISAIRFTKIYKQQVKIMSKLFPVLENYVDATYLGAVRMMILAGFKLEEPMTINGNLFRKFTMVSA